MSTSDLIKNGPRVIGVGLQGFINDLNHQGHPATAVDWRPPASKDLNVLAAAESLSSGSLDKPVSYTHLTLPTKA